VSDDGRQGIAVIGMIGNVFSPSYARARSRPEKADPMQHCTLNVAVYGERRNTWALTERGRRDVERRESSLVIGGSVMRWEKGSLVVDIREACAPFGGRIEGTLKLHPKTWTQRRFELDAAGRHGWWPVVPSARVELDLREPNVRFRGHGYHDTNTGDEPLEAAFKSWTWSRSRLSGDRTAITYDVTCHDGQVVSIGRLIHSGGDSVALPEMGWAPLPKTLWQLERATRTEPNPGARLVRTLEDTPFYARSLISTAIWREPCLTVHETVSLDRFKSPWVQFLLPFRMGKG
jgi:carotenoid 1,2-hydratase